MRTYSPKPGDVTRNWHVIDATDVVLGRLASQTARLLRGKHKPIWAPHADTGDFVVIVNASNGQEAEGVRGPGAPARRAEPAGVRDHPGRAVTAQVHPENSERVST